jgi:hypothetical protein
MRHRARQGKFLQNVIVIRHGKRRYSPAEDEEKNPVGWPLKYKTVAELDLAIQTYFDECDPHIVKHMEATERIRMELLRKPPEGGRDPVDGHGEPDPGSAWPEPAVSDPMDEAACPDCYDG